MLIDCLLCEVSDRNLYTVARNADESSTPFNGVPKPSKGKKENPFEALVMSTTSASPISQRLCCMSKLSATEGARSNFADCRIWPAADTDKDYCLEPSWTHGQMVRQSRQRGWRQAILPGQSQPARWELLKVCITEVPTPAKFGQPAPWNLHVTIHIRVC